MRRAALVRATGMAADAEGRAVADEDVLDRVAAGGGREDADDRGRAALLHRDRRQPDVERAGGEEALDEQLHRTAGSCRRCWFRAGARRRRSALACPGSRRSRPAGRSARAARGCRSRSRSPTARSRAGANVARVVRMAAPVGVSSSPRRGVAVPASVAEIGAPRARQQLGRGRRRHREQPVGGADEARPDPRRAAETRLDAEAAPDRCRRRRCRRWRRRRRPRGSGPPRRRRRGPSPRPRPAGRRSPALRRGPARQGRSPRSARGSRASARAGWSSGDLDVDLGARGRRGCSTGSTGS